MPSQIINLLPKVYRKVHIPYSAHKVLAAAGGCAALMLAGYSIMQWQIVSRDEAIAATQAEKKALEQEIDHFKAGNVRKVLDKTLVYRIGRYEHMLTQRQAFLRRMDSGDLGFSEGFSEYLLAFGRQGFPEVWLDSIRLTENGKEVQLSGKAVAPNHVPRYLEALQREPALEHVVFEDLSMGRAKQLEGDFVQFSVASGPINQANQPLSLTPLQEGLTPLQDNLSPRGERSR